jgi:hypothetical protein
VNDWRRDLGASSQAFVNFAWPAVKDLCGGGTLELVESTTAEGFQKQLDVLAGIDSWQLLDGRGYMRGIASRMQQSDNNWKTFTIRKSRSSGARTELEKRLEQIARAEEGALYPYLTVQGYVRHWTNGPLIGAAVVRTADLYKFVVEHEADIKPLPNRADGNWFYPVGWGWLRHCGVKVHCWPEPNKAAA